MKIIKSHFWYSKSQRNGILFLLVLLFSVQLAFFYVDFSHKDALSREDIAQFQASLDSIREIKSTRPATIYTFNPNFITDHKGYQLGMNPDQIDRLLAFRKEGNFVNSKEEFQAVTQVNDSLLNLISVKFKFPSWVKEKKKVQRNTKEFNPPGTKDLNKVKATELKTVTGLDWRIVNRIIAYRNLLKGFSIDDQLYEVYGLSEESAHLILKYFKVIDRPKFKKTNINTADFKSVLALPYIDYALTRRIFEFRDENGPIKSIENLKKIDSFPIEKFDRIALYLSAE